MSGKDGFASVTGSSASLNKAESKAVRAPTAKAKASRTSRKSTNWRQMIAQINADHRKQIRAIKMKYLREVKLLRVSLKVQARQSKDSIRKAAAESKKIYQDRLNKISLEYQRQNASLREELQKKLEDSFNEIAMTYQTSVTSESDTRFDSLKKLIQNDFVDELQRKVDEIEQLRTQSEKELSEAVQEGDLKGHRMSQLESRLKEVSQYLPEGVRDEIYEQFGFEEDMEEIEVARPKRRSFFGRLTSMI